MIKKLREIAGQHIKAYYDNIDAQRDITNLSFDVERYVSRGFGIPRSEMPQIDWKELTEILPTMSKVTKINAGQTQAEYLKPSQGEINISKVMKKIAKGKKVPETYVFIVDKNWHIIDGHHKHVQLLIQQPNAFVSYIKFEEYTAPELIFMFNKFTSTRNVDVNDNIIECNQIFESYGSQGPEAAGPGMGAVEFPKVATNPGDAMNPENRGSGDVPTTSTTKDDDDERLMRYSKHMSAYGDKFEEVDVLKIPLDDNHPLADVMDMDK